MSCITNVSKSLTPSEIPNHSHHEHEIIFLVSGKVTVETAQGLIDINSPSVISIGNLEKHSIRSENPYERFIITLNPARLPPEEGVLFLFFLPQFQIINVSDISEKLFNLFSMLSDEYSETEQKGEHGCMLILQTILLLMYRRHPEGFPDGGNSIAQTVRKVQAALQSNLDSDISLSFLAQQYHVSMYHLSHSFKRITGYSIAQYRMIYKIRIACELLSKTGMSISDICAHIGFSDMSNFSRQFKKQLGCSPSAYRKKHG